MTKLVPSAAAIGSLFTKARRSHTDSVRYLIDCGRALNAAKEAIPRGDWVFWLKDHHAELGFEEQTAQRMMKAAKTAKASLTTDLKDEEAAKINRVIWGNTTKEVPMLEDQTSPAIKRLRKFVEWSRGKSSAEVFAELDREEVVEFKALAGEAAAWLIACTEEMNTRPRGVLIEQRISNG